MKVKWSWQLRLSSALAVSSLSVAGLAGPVEAGGPATVGRLSAWTACGEGLECATLPVPLDHARPAAGTIELAVIRRPAADPARRIGSLVYLEGGPGVSGFDSVRDSAELVEKPVRDRFDVVGFDQRGVGRSAPVRCYADTEAAEKALIGGLPWDRSAASGSRWLAVAPVGAKSSYGDEVLAGFDETVEEQRRFAEGCGRLSGPLLPYLSTEAAARDLDLLRAALGESRLTAYGASYGTELGVTYAALFPTRLRALVLDAVVDPRLSIDNPFVEIWLQATAFEKAFDTFLGNCKRDPECTFGHGDPAGAYDRLLARLAEKPLYVRNEDANTVTEVDASVVRFAVEKLLYNESNWPKLELGLQRADDYDDGSVLLDVVQGSSDQEDGVYDNLAEANAAINCADQSYPTDLAFYRGFAATMALEAPRFGPMLALVGLPCAFWPTSPASRYTGPFQAPGAPPILVIGTTGDTATPYVEARSLASQLGDRAVMLTWRSFTHGAYGNSTCINEATNRYLIDLVPPKPNTVCQ
ncbi:alpha/beta hydrolase [Frankia nepalensis]|uniref:alpha/beta hydrolase n=1 Tax=Frankia nepalensis TaxID=1836974 RepID=UPI0027DE6FD5|nr:alpha/beta hydrolase [Frankia nepalensis]